MMIKKLSAARIAAAQARKNRGLSLAEAGLVLALGMLVAVIAFSGYSYGSNSIKTRSQVGSTIELVNNVVRTYASAQNYSGVSNGVIVNGNLVPAGFRSAQGEAAGEETIATTWGGEIVVEPGTDNTEFTITLSDIPKTSCVDFVTGVASIATGVSVAGTAVKPVGTANLDIGTLTTQCNALGGEGGDDDIVITAA